MGSVMLNGLSLHGPDEFGAVWKVHEIEHWLEPAETTGTVEQREYSDGGYADEAFDRPKIIVLKGRVSAPDRAGVLAALGRLREAIPKSVLAPITVGDVDGFSHRMVRQDGQPLLPKPNDRIGTFNVQLIAPDSRRHSGDGSGPSYTVEVALPSEQGGLAAPFTLPVAVDATVISGSVDVTNVGDAAPKVIANIIGPAPQPTITTTNGQAMKFDLTVAAGDFLEVDFDKRTVKLNGVASRRGTLRGRWITFDTTSTTLRFDAAAYNPDARMSVSWSDAHK
jgi:hypothetical protein